MKPERRLNADAMLPEKNLPWWRHDRPWGFRFSAMDLAIMLTGVVATCACWTIVGPYALLIPFVLLHFFLFCNVFRVGGERSLIWVGTFLLNVFFSLPPRPLTIPIAIQLMITIALVAHCVCGKNYHGFACSVINPEGYRRGAMTEGAFTRRVLLKCGLPRPVIEKLTGRKLNEFDE